MRCQKPARTAETIAALGATPHGKIPRKVLSNLITPDWPLTQPLRLFFALLANAEAREDFAEQIVGAELAGDRIHRVLRLPQLFCK